MVKTAAQSKTDALVAEDDIERSLAVISAKQQFVSSAMNMGWQMAGMVLIPVFVGVQLDKRFHSSPSYTLSALILAVGGVVYIVKNTINGVNKEQARAETVLKPTKKRKVK